MEGQMVDLVDCERGKYFRLVCSILLPEPVPHDPKLGDVSFAVGLAGPYGNDPVCWVIPPHEDD